MPTTREVAAAKVERQRAEARFYTPDLLGKKCRHCSLRIPLALEEAGILIHPTCGPSEVPPAFRPPSWT